MDTNHINSADHSQRLGQLILQLQRLERNPRSFGEAGMLTPSEIHTVDAIGMRGGVRMGELAERLGVTKGAVTQLTNKLAKKELIRRGSHPADSRAVLLSLTKKGESAYQAHCKEHEHFYKKLREQLPSSELAALEKSLKIFTDVLKDIY